MKIKERESKMRSIAKVLTVLAIISFLLGGVIRAFYLPFLCGIGPRSFAFLSIFCLVLAIVFILMEKGRS